LVDELFGESTSSECQFLLRIQSHSLQSKILQIIEDLPITIHVEVPPHCWIKPHQLLRDQLIIILIPQILLIYHTILLHVLLPMLKRLMHLLRLLQLRLIPVQLLMSEPLVKPLRQPTQLLLFLLLLLLTLLLLSYLLLRVMVLTLPKLWMVLLWYGK
jgi:hypothetical protein